MDTLPAFQSGGAGLVSTLKDYANFGTMLLNGGNFKGRQILEPEIVRYFTQGTLHLGSRSHCLAAGVVLRAIAMAILCEL